IESHHEDAVGAVHRQERQNDVVNDQSRDLGRFIRHWSSSRWLLLVAGEAVALGFLLLPDTRRNLVPFLSLFLAGGALSLRAAGSPSGTSHGFLLLAGALFRATVLFKAPDLSEDLYRYLWDGHVARTGISPYRYAPNDPALDHISSNLRAHLAHREI